MVDVNPVNKNTTVSVNSSGSVSQIKTTTPQNYYDGLAKQWAIDEGLVQGIDYSSKHYAQESEKSAKNAQAYTKQAEEVKNEAVSEINLIKTETTEIIQGISNTTIQNITEIKDNAISNIGTTKEETLAQIENEAKEQLQNIQSTGFYMRDDKLYFINSKGEEEEFAGGSGFNLFDTKIADHILEGEEALGWALQGTYVTKALYPDFYNECLTQKNVAVETEVILGDNPITIFKHNNGHQFFNIADKTIVDAFFDTFGIADFYGIDEENERVFLPRNKYFAIQGVAPVVGNGLTLGLTNGSLNMGLSKAAHTHDGTNNYLAPSSGFGSNVGASVGIASPTNYLSIGVTADPTKSGVEAKLTPNENKYLYYCVGNTEVTQAITNVTEVTTSENDTTPLFTGMYFDFKPNNVSWLKAGEQQNNEGIYKTCYETLVEIVNGVNKYDLKVINIADKLADVDYSEYWILDQDNLTFRTPLAIATKSLSGAVKGNGMTLGLTDGKTNVGLYNSSVEPNNMSFRTDVYNAPVGSTISTNGTASNTSLGVTTDPTKSGIVSEQSTAQLYFKVANAVQNLELLNAGEVLEALTDKLDRGHKEEITSWGIPDYSASTSISFTAGTTWIVPYDCELFFTQATGSGGGALKIRINNSSGPVIFWAGSSTELSISTDRARFKKGTTLYIERMSGTWTSKIITPLIGANL